MYNKSFHDNRQSFQHAGATKDYFSKRLSLPEIDNVEARVSEDAKVFMNAPDSTADRYFNVP